MGVVGERESRRARVVPVAAVVAATVAVLVRVLLLLLLFLLLRVASYPCF